MNRRTKLLALAQLGALRVIRGQERPTYRSDVRLVTVDVLVTERSSRKVVDVLGAKDFVIFDDGQPRELSFFEIETTPLDVVFVPYLAGWFAGGRDYNEFVRGWRAALAALRDGDRAGLVRSLRHADNVPLTGRHEEVRDALHPAGGSGGTRIGRGAQLYEVLKLAAAMFRSSGGEHRRRSIVAITDNAEDGSATGLKELTDSLLAADCTLNLMVLATVNLGGSAGRVGPWPFPGRQRQIGGGVPSGQSCRGAAEATGGVVIPGDQMATNLPSLIRQTQLRYLLGFYANPSGPAQFRALSIELSEDARRRHPAAEIKHRKGYMP